MYFSSHEWTQINTDIRVGGVNIFFSAMSYYRHMRSHCKSIICLDLCSSVFICGSKL